MITIVDTKAANVRSVRNMFKKIGHPATIAATAEEAKGSTCLVLPGVGAFDPAARQLRNSGLNDFLQDAVMVRGVPILGICLGFQLMTQGSEEGSEPGLGWLDAEVVRFPEAGGRGGLQVPHMGWNTVAVEKDIGLFPQPPEEQRFYFVHSYYVRCTSPEDVLTSTEYGVRFTSAAQKGHVVGVQFHPEKSHRFGMAFLSRFAELAGAASKSHAPA